MRSNRKLVGIVLSIVLACSGNLALTTQTLAESCDIIQLTSTLLSSSDIAVCGDGTGLLFVSRADLANNGHVDQEDIFFADVSDPFNPVFHQLTNTPQDERRLSISDDCSRIGFSSRSNLVGMNASNFDQMYFGDISDLDNPSFTQLTNSAVNNTSVDGSISGDGTKMGLSSQEDLTGDNLNPDGSREFFIYDRDNGVEPFGQLTNDDMVGSITSTAIVNNSGSRVAFTSTDNYIPPDSNANGGRELYLADISFDSPNPAASTLYQVTDFPNNSFHAGGLDFTPDGETMVFSSNADITGNNADGNTDLFLADVTDPANPVFTQITESMASTASGGIIDATGSLIAFITDNIDFSSENTDGSDEIVLANISNVNQPVFIPATDFPVSTEVNDLAAPDDMSFIAFASESDVVPGGNQDRSTEIFIMFTDCSSPGIGAVPDGAVVPGTQLRANIVGGQLRLSWGESCLLSDTDYEVYAGSLGDFTSHMPVTCSTGGLLGWGFPVPTEDQYFLVVPTDGMMEGSYGRNSKAAERPTSSAACSAQALGSCPEGSLSGSGR